MRQSEANFSLSPYGCRVEFEGLSKDESFFWMGGRLAFGLEEISHDPASLDTPGFWAAFSTFEGEWTCVRFAHVVAGSLPEISEDWQPVTSAWQSSLSEGEYVDYVKEIQEQIAQGWVYQVNACRQVNAPMAEQSLLPLMHEILKKNPAPYASYLRLSNIEIASASPELFLERHGSKVISAPIKGTKLPGSDEIPFGSKDTAENIMIVDLIRNDLGRICKTGSVSVPKLLETQPHPGLSHLVSYVEGSLRDAITWQEISDGLLPPGSVSGAPKSSAVSTISKLEGLHRGPYCGALGWVEDQQALFSLAIRIFWSEKDGVLRFGTGAGITWGSDPDGEWEETELKARRLIAIANGEIG
ncbi:MAG: chorismate-binding protein [Candidatus Nanopelagicaceae bacterium]|nr:chorismate-binding protein [Candidatus Nanopelagicaceae bacterium]